MTPWPVTWAWEQEQGREWPALIREAEQLMVRHSDGKNPFAPWGDRTHPDYDSDDPEKGDARYAWSIPDQWSDFETTRRWAQMDPSLASDCVFILQRESDPYRAPADRGIFIDGDDVRDLETGDVHPAWPFLLAFLFPNGTYADISTSETGGHAMGRGTLPDGVKQISFDLPDNPEYPDATVEIYDGKRVCVATGYHVQGTPDDCREIDEDALETLADAFGTAHPEETTGEGYDPETFEPTKTRAETADIDTTNDVRDIYDAVHHLRPADLSLRSRHVGNESPTTESWHPAYRSTESGESLKRFDSGTFVDMQAMEQGFDVLSLYAAEQGILTRPWHQLAGEDWVQAVEHARDAGAPIPTYTGPTGDTDHVALLPNAPIERAKSGTGAAWDWQAGGEETDTLTTDDVRERTHDAIASAYERGDRVLIDAIMSAGKSYGAIKAAAVTGEQITFLTGRGRDEQYDQVQEWCDEHGLSSVVLPTISDCETFAGRYENDDEHPHAGEQTNTVRRWYENGATGKDIHMHAEDELGEPLVCDGPAGARCTYKVRWEALDPDDYDVLIGHYNHAHVQNVVHGRTLVIDEFPDDTYSSEFGPRLASAVTAFLKRHEDVDELPEDYADLMEVRTDIGRRSDALAWLLDRGVDRDGTLAFEKDGQANAPLAAFTLLAAAENDLANGFERAVLPGQYGGNGGNGIGVYDRENGHVKLLTPPDIRYASGVVALDGTPVPAMWDLVLGDQLNHRQVLTDGERADYITESQNLDIVRTTEYVKSYSRDTDNPQFDPAPDSNSHNVYLEEDRALLEEIAEQHRQKPDLITTRAAEVVYENDENGILDSVNEREHHGNVKGSNKFADSRLGVVIGSRHFGDRYVQQWGAFAGECVERGDGRGVDLEYSGIGGEIHKHMTHHETMQAVMRFGRDGKGATVYVHTNTLPDWVPLAGEGRVSTVWSDGMKQVLTAANDFNEWRTADLAAHPSVEIGERQIRKHLHTLADRGEVSVTIEGRGFTWHNDGLYRVNEHGEITLPTLGSDDVTNEEIAELVGIESYTWKFRNPSSQNGGQVVRPNDEPRVAGNRGGSTGGSVEFGD